MSKKVYVVKAFLDKATKEMNVPVTFLMSDNSMNDCIVTPEGLFETIEWADKRLGIMKKALKSYKKATFLLAGATSVLALHNIELRKENKRCREEAREAKEKLEDDLFVADLEEDIETTMNPTDI